MESNTCLVILVEWLHRYYFKNEHKLHINYINHNQVTWIYVAYKVNKSVPSEYRWKNAQDY